MKNIPVRHLRSAVTEPAFSGHFNIRDIKTMLNGNDLIQELHRHDFFFILALQDGTGHHEIDFELYQVTGNSVFCMRPGQVHQLTLHRDCTGYLMAFNAGFYRPEDKLSLQKLRRATYRNHCQLQKNRFEKLYTILKNIFQEYTYKEDDYQGVIKASLDIFFIEFVRQSQNTDQQATHINSYRQERLEEFFELLQANITTLKQVSQYTELMNLSLYQLNEITKTTMAKTASDLINEHIILEAKRYLLATFNQIKIISEQLGYDDVSYFIRFFKKHTGYSPDVFRQNFRKVLDK
jgi:AraC family transcriptional regulator, transcriptional activator of pobA